METSVNDLKPELSSVEKMRDGLKNSGQPWLPDRLLKSRNNFRNKIVSNVRKIEESLERKNKTTRILKTGCFDNLDSAVILSSVSKAVQN